MANQNKRDSDLLSTSLTSIAILEELNSQNGATLKSLDEEFDIHRTTIHGHLSTLRSKQVIIKDDDDQYWTGPKLLELGYPILSRKQHYEVAGRYVEKLHEKTNHRVIFVDEFGGRAMFLHTKSGSHPDWDHVSVGRTIHLHNTAVGKAILSVFTNDKIRSITNRIGLPATTSETITDVQSLVDEVETIREQGYATNKSENIEGMHALGKSATDTDGELLGAFALSGSRDVLPEENPEILEILTETIEEFELEVSL
jgi:DNA-binding IclR family transcriptional regulator